MLMLYYIAANCWTNYQHTGHVFADRDQQFQIMVQYLPYLAVSVFGVYFLSFSAFVLHRLVVAGYVRGVAEVVLQHCLQALLIFGAVYLATHPTADGWPLTQRLALLLQTMVSFMKMVSCAVTPCAWAWARSVAWCCRYWCLALTVCGPWTVCVWVCCGLASTRTP